MLKKCLIGIVVLVWAVLSVIQIRDINKKYPNPKVITYVEAEEIKGGDISIYVQGSRLLSYEELGKSYSDADLELLSMDGEKISLDKIKIMIVDMEVENTGDGNQQMSMENFILQSGAWSNGWDMDLFLSLNHTEETMIHLQPYEKKNVKLGYCMYAFQFRAKDWKAVLNREYDLILSTYPVKNKVHLGLS